MIIKNIKQLMVVKLMLFLFQVVYLQGSVPENVTPYVQLGYKVKISVYMNAIVDNKANSILSLGKLISESIEDSAVGSGTIVSQDGLILTNYHVYNLKRMFRYNKKLNRLYVKEPISKSMLVFRLVDNDPIKPPVLQYQASPVALDRTHDTALLKIYADAKGKKIAIKGLHFSNFTNPFAMKLNQTLYILGYPTKGGDTITITEGKFLGYYRRRSMGGLDGFIKTDAAMSPGNSGGAALDKEKIVGVPTGVTFPTQAGADMGYIHPVTWAVKVLTIARQKFKFKVQDIPVEWLLSSSNTDSTRKNIYLTGNLVSSHNMGPLQAEVLITRPDRTLEQIQNLHLELQRIIRIQAVHNMHNSGVPADQIASSLKMKTTEVTRVLNTNPADIKTQPDVQKYSQGIFFYAVTKSDNKGFFIIDVPRNQKVKFYAFANAHRTMVRYFTSRKGTSQHIGNIAVYKY